jgi:hypothetical protein
VSANGLYHDILACHELRVASDTIQRTSSGHPYEVEILLSRDALFLWGCMEAEKVILTMSTLTVCIIFLALTLAYPGDSRAHVDLLAFMV